jgi:hypothetical protein
MTCGHAEDLRHASDSQKNSLRLIHQDCRFRSAKTLFTVVYGHARRLPDTVALLDALDEFLIEVKDRSCEIDDFSGETVAKFGIVSSAPCIDERPPGFPLFSNYGPDVSNGSLRRVAARW